MDAISGAGAMPLETEAWGVDVVVVGSQKALALPPGLAFVSVSARAWERIESARSRRASTSTSAASARRRPAANRPSRPRSRNVVALRAALDCVEALGGVDALVKNAATLAASTRAAAGALRPAAGRAEGLRRRAHRALSARRASTPARS